VRQDRLHWSRSDRRADGARLRSRIMGGCAHCRGVGASRIHQHNFWRGQSGCYGHFPAPRPPVKLFQVGLVGSRAFMLQRAAHATWRNTPACLPQSKVTSIPGKKPPSGQGEFAGIELAFLVDHVSATRTPSLARSLACCNNFRLRRKMVYPFPAQSFPGIEQRVRGTA